MADTRPDPAKRLQAAREAMKIGTATEAAERFGWNQHTYILHENGGRGIARAAKRYAAAYKVSEAWLLTGTGPGPGEHAEAISRLTTAYREAPQEMRDHLLREAEHILLAAEALRRREADGAASEDQGDEQ